ncbi:MAG: hypothetical protein ABFQ62_02605 [Patescibacteria group bacterium]
MNEARPKPANFDDDTQPSIVIDQIMDQRPDAGLPTVKIEHDPDDTQPSMEIDARVSPDITGTNHTPPVRPEKN